MSVQLYFNCQTTVNDRIISGNLDFPESGLDGLLQAVVCDEVSSNLSLFLTHTHTHANMFYSAFHSADHWLETKTC